MSSEASPSAVEVDGLSKAYRVELERGAADTLGETLLRAVRAPVLNLQRLRRLTRFDEHDEDDVVWALRDVSLRVGEGEVLGVIGANGAGKTTLLKILAGITGPTRGRGLVRGRVASLLEVGTGFHPELSGRENIFLNGSILGMTKPEIERSFEEIVAFSGIERFLDTPIKRYSSGMRVRLAFSVAAHLEAEILLVDEVLAVGDAAFQRRCLGKMQSVVGEGRTILFVSHNMVAVEGLCSRVVWLDRGRVRADGEAREVTGSYLASVASAERVREWSDPADAPGNEAIRLHRIEVAGPQSARSGLLRRNQPLDLVVEYSNAKPGARLTVTLHLLTAEGAVAFSTSTLHGEPRWQGRPFPAGRYRSGCQIPPNLLNSGAYRLRLLFVEDEGRVLLQLEDIVSFVVHDVPEGRGAYFGARPGAVAPMLVWSTERLDARDPG